MPCPSIGLKWFWTIQIVLDGYKLFWSEPNRFGSGPNSFGQVQIRFFWTNFFNLDLSNMIWTQPKWIRPIQKDWYLTKMILTIQNHFGPIEGQSKSQTSVLLLILKIFFFLHNSPYLLTLVKLITESVFIIIIQLFVTTKDSKDKVG